MEALDRGLQPNIRASLISAPAGYGKTTLLSAWVRSRQLQAVWLSLSEGDNDPTRFITYLVAAMVNAGVELDIPTFGEGQISEEEFRGRFLIPLINQVGSQAKQMALILDDYHLVRSQTVHDQVGYLLENLPQQAHIYLATREDPSLPLARLRGRGQVNELRMEDLRFRIDESEAFLRFLAEPSLTMDDIHTLHRRTEGWISGLQMAAASLRGHEDIGAFIEGFSGSHHYIMDYLLDEVLRREPEERQTFLLDTSILERLNGSLCDAVRDLSPRSHLTSQKILTQLERSNLFIVPLDEKREWYRYHRLFSDLLQARLQRKHPERLPALHRRASEWFEKHGFVNEAVRHALSTSDAEFGADMIERRSQEVLLRGETTTFLYWVQRLPEDQIKARPKLGIYLAWALLLQGAPLSAVEAHISDSREGRGPPGSSRSLEAFIHISQGHLDEGLALAKEALELLPAEEVFLRNFAAICAAGGYISLGDFEGGMKFMNQVTRSAQGARNRSATIMILCELAELRLKQLRLQEAEQLYQRALEIGTDQDGERLPIAGHAMMGLGNIALDRYQLECAERWLLEGIRLAGRWSLIGTLDGYFSLVLLYEAQGKDALLEEALAKLRDLSLRFDASDIDDIVVDILRAHADLRRGNLAAVREWVEKRGLGWVPDRKPADARGDSMLARLYKYELPILARWYLAEARYDKALQVLHELSDQAAHAQRPRLQIESGILQAMAYHLQDDHTAAMSALSRALELAQPEGLKRIFLVEGDDILQLLKRLRAEPGESKASTFAGHLLDTVEVPSPGVPGSAEKLLDPLSPREMEVLRLLPTGLSAAEMADELTISVNTIRSHLKNIYAKLGVHSRHEAVAKATQTDLL